MEAGRHLSLLPFVKYTIQANYRETFHLKVRAARLTPSASVNTRHNRYVVPFLPFLSLSLSLPPLFLSLSPPMKSFASLFARQAAILPVES